jgi:hypothetical protein
MDFVTAHRDLTDAVTTLRTRTTAPTRSEYVNTAMEPYGPHGIYRHLPDSERVAVLRKTEAEYDGETELALGDVETVVHDLDGELGAAIDAAKQLPARPLDRWLMEKGSQAHTSAEWLAADTRALLVRQELRAELATAAPGAVLSAYVNAYSSNDLEVVHYIETHYATGWPGAAATTDDPELLAAALELRKAITATREARVPSHLRQLEAAVTQARRLARQVQSLTGLQPRRRE